MQKMSNTKHARNNCLSMAARYREKALAARNRGQLIEAQKYMEEADRWMKKAENWKLPEQKQPKEIASFFGAIAGKNE